MIQWAIDRSGRDRAEIDKKCPGLSQWLDGELAPTLNQLEKFARATRAPIGYLFLDTPPAEPLPIPDFRTIDSAAIARPSPDLLDTLYLCLQRQDWYRQNALLLREDPIAFVGSVTIRSDEVATAKAIREAVGFDLSARGETDSFESALRMMTKAADDAGVLVMTSGVVGQNTSRPLNTEEFRGFALSDDYAPLVFINGTDTKAGQMFTLAHELAHLWLGQSALTDASAGSIARGGANNVAAPRAPANNSTAKDDPRKIAEVERWCNAVAAEMLVPLEGIKQTYSRLPDVRTEMNRLAKVYKVSTLVILRRMFDAGGLTRAAFQEAYNQEAKRLREVMAKKKEQSEGGGDYYNTARTRVSPRFARAVIAATWEGRSSFTDAFRLIGVGNVKQLETFGERVGMSSLLQGGAA